MKYTPLGFKKPELSDYVSVLDLNDNADLYDSMIATLEAEMGAIIPILDEINGEVI